jgi:alpha-galactosidase
MVLSPDGSHHVQREKLYGYSSWYNRYQNIDEASIEQDLERDAPRSFQKNDLFQIDDGWEPYVGDWLEPDAKKFPNGMKKMADQIHAAGYRAGIWLAPFAAEEKSKLYQEHPDWFIKKDGRTGNAAATGADSILWISIILKRKLYPKVFEKVLMSGDMIWSNWTSSMVQHRLAVKRKQGLAGKSKNVSGDAAAAGSLR